MSIRSRALALGALLMTAGAFGAWAAVVTPQIGGGIDFGTDGGISGVSGVVTPQPTGKILLVDAASFILQTDAASKICRAGGC